MIGSWISMLFLSGLAFFATPGETARSVAAAPEGGMVLAPSRSPLVTFRFAFHTGAAFDPPGKEGLAALTAACVAEAGSQTLTYDEVLNRLHPIASKFEWQVDKEMTVLHGATHLDNLWKYYAVISQMIFSPGFRPADFNRLRTNAINAIEVDLRANNDEELGKERLYNLIYEGHPYGHPNLGRVGSLKTITLDDVRGFYTNHFTRANLTLALGGGYPPEFLKQVEEDLRQLPAGEPRRLEIPRPAAREGMRVDIVSKEARATAISFGFPIEVNRAHPDWAALAVASSYFGQHRSSSGVLFQRLRADRGLNYGTYSYIEYFPRGMFQFRPDPNLARQSQIFQVWIRPVPLGQGRFSLRTALFELDRLIQRGMSQEAFEATREFLGKYAVVLTDSNSSALGYAIDSKWYGVADYRTFVAEELKKLTVEKVNAAIRKHLSTQNVTVVIVTKDGNALREAILNEKTSPITYSSPKPASLLEEDKRIEAYPLPLKPTDVTVTPVERVFE